MTIASLIKFGRRQLHTIVSTEIIKPSLPAPSHLKTYHLSPTDQFVPSVFIPFVTFYPNTNINHSPHDQIRNLKSSLSQTLTKYYPFAGRYDRIIATYVDCNDHGAEFVEASVDSTLSNFLQNSKHEDLDQFFPYGRIYRYDLQNNDSVIPLAVTFNRFQCGGVALAVSLSHKIADACSLFHFLEDWAKLTRLYSKNETHEDVPIEPHFISFEHTLLPLPEFSLEVTKDCVTKSFIFPKSKLNALKQKVKSMSAGSEQHITNPTRVEVLTWLLYKCSTAAATKNNLGCFKPSSIGLAINIRDKVIEKSPKNLIGNLVMGLEVQTMNETELNPGLLISELRKQKMGIQGLNDIKHYIRLYSNILSSLSLQERETKIENAHICSSLCGYPVFGSDFGWRNPVKATLAGNLKKNSFVIMDAPNKEGVEVLVCLEKQEMDIVQRDLELLAFC